MRAERVEGERERNRKRWRRESRKGGEIRATTEKGKKRKRRKRKRREREEKEEKEKKKKKSKEKKRKKRKKEKERKTRKRGKGHKREEAGGRKANTRAAAREREQANSVTRWCCRPHSSSFIPHPFIACILRAFADLSLHALNKHIVLLLKTSTAQVFSRADGVLHSTVRLIPLPIVSSF